MMKKLSAGLTALIIAACNQQNPSLEQSRYVVTDDNIRLYYSEQGTGTDVLIAPAGFYLEPYLMDVLSENRRVIMYDSRNRGRSQSAPLETITLDRQVQDLEQLRKALDIEKMALLGWSVHGMEVVVYALRYPDRVTRLIQVSPASPASSITTGAIDARINTVDQEALETLQVRAKAGEFTETPAEYCRLYNAVTLPPYFADTNFIDEFIDICQYENEYPEKLTAHFRAYLPTIGDYDLRDELIPLTAPRLVIHGREDGIPLASARAWAAGYENARIVVLPSSGHFPYIEQREQVQTAIRAFLNGEWPNDAQEGP